MLRIRHSEERGKADHGWLKSYHSFSFADYYDPQHLKFHSLRVINEDWVSPGMGFGLHPHREMEIITYVVSGSVQHKDSMGNAGIVSAGEIQVMSAGTGVQHSEMNPSSDEILHLLQIWILPNQAPGKPGYAQAKIPWEGAVNKLIPLVNEHGRNGAIAIKQDASLFAGRFSPGESLSYSIDTSRSAWIQVVEGSLSLQDQTLKKGDACAIERESQLNVHFLEQTEILLFDLF